ncbi:MAG TPA: hypothetical protein VK206_18610 [Anaerolineales bacterium]|nr:hypothetical protein [Anaerolineales bacterium]
MNTSSIGSNLASTEVLSLKFRKTILAINGIFLMAVGGLFTIFDLTAYLFGVGPLGSYLYGLHYTIGFVEAHGLAFFLGLLLFRVAAADPKPYWHLLGVGIHLLLGGSNLIFWQLAIDWNAVRPEIVVTVIHGLFAVLQLSCYWLVSRRQN